MRRCSTLEELAPTQGEQVLLHQDLHADNVLAAQREPWLVIDPKPLVGEREFASRRSSAPASSATASAPSSDGWTG